MDYIDSYFLVDTKYSLRGCGSHKVGAFDKHSKTRILQSIIPTPYSYSIESPSNQEMEIYRSKQMTNRDQIKIHTLKL